MLDPLALDIAHLFAGGLVLVSVMLVSQDRMTGLINTFALHALVVSVSVAWQALLQTAPFHRRAMGPKTPEAFRQSPTAQASLEERVVTAASRLTLLPTFGVGTRFQSPHGGPAFAMAGMHLRAASSRRLARVPFSPRCVVAL